MQLVIKDGKVIAEHEDYQDIIGKYTSCEVTVWAGDLPPLGIDDPQRDDPRTPLQKRQAYRDRRREAYPKMREQLDMMYHDQLDGTTTWVDAVTAVKEQFPKPVDL